MGENSGRWVEYTGGNRSWPHCWDSSDIQAKKNSSNPLGMGLHRVKLFRSWKSSWNYIVVKDWNVGKWTF